MPISLEEFRAIVEQPKTKTAAKVSSDELVEWLKDKAATTKEIAEFLQVRPAAARSRIMKLVKAKVLKAKFDGKKTYYTSGE